MSWTGASVNSVPGKLQLRPRQHIPSAKFLAQQSALTSRICSIVEQDVSRSYGEAMMTARQRAREIATFNRLRE